MVQSGDNANDIALRFGVTVEELAAANDTTVDNLRSLEVGQVLIIPPPRQRLLARTTAPAATATRATTATAISRVMSPPPAVTAAGFLATATVLEKFWLFTLTSSLWSPLTAFHENSSGKSESGSMLSMVASAGHERPEVLAAVLLDVERGQELGVEVARREAEARPAVVLDDADDVAGADLVDGARDAVRAVVVGRDGERPGAEPVVRAREVACRGARRGDGIAPLVDRVAHLHVETPGGRHELPDARRADLRIGGDVEARLDERQAGELDRQPLVAEDALHLREVLPRGAEAVCEALADAALSAHRLWSAARRNLYGSRSSRKRS